MNHNNSEVNTQSTGEIMFFIKECEKAVKTHETIIRECEDKRSNAEKQLITLVRVSHTAKKSSNDKAYRDALCDTIATESEHIVNSINKITEYNNRIRDYKKSINV